MARHRLTQAQLDGDHLSPAFRIREQLREQLHVRRAEFIETALTPSAQHSEDHARATTQESDPSA